MVEGAGGQSTSSWSFRARYLYFVFGGRFLWEKILERKARPQNSFASWDQVQHDDGTQKARGHCQRGVKMWKYILISKGRVHLMQWLVSICVQITPTEQCVTVGVGKSIIDQIKILPTCVVLAACRLLVHFTLGLVGKNFHRASRIRF